MLATNEIIRIFNNKNIPLLHELLTNCKILSANEFLKVRQPSFVSTQGLSTIDDLLASKSELETVKWEIKDSIETWSDHCVTIARIPITLKAHPIPKQVIQNKITN